MNQEQREEFLARVEQRGEAYRRACEEVLQEMEREGAADDATRVELEAQVRMVQSGMREMVELNSEPFDSYLPSNFSEDQ